MRRTWLVLLAVALFSCGKPEVTNTETKSETGGIKVVTVTAACHGGDKDKCYSAALYGVVSACDIVEWREELSVQKSAERVVTTWRCYPKLR